MICKYFRYKIEIVDKFNWHTLSINVNKFEPREKFNVSWEWTTYSIGFTVLSYFGNMS
jgi:hypothetical protein